MGEPLAGLAYGCCFCVSGREQQVAEHIRQALPGARALVAQQEKHKSMHGEKSRVQQVLFPGYVFFEAPADAQPALHLSGECVIRVLTTHDGVWQLAGRDEHFVRWLFRCDGLLGFSKAYKEGDSIRIISGPLKDLEGWITRMDKRGHSGQVVLRFGGKAVPVWLGFELLECLDENG